MENKSLILVTKNFVSIVETCFIFPFIVAKEQRFLDDQRAIYLTLRLR